MYGGAPGEVPLQARVIASESRLTAGPAGDSPAVRIARADEIERHSPANAGAGSVVSRGV